MFIAADDQVQDGLSKPDENWWNSVLGDEEKYVINNDQPESIQMSNQPVGSDMDWEYLDDVFREDTIIHLDVTGYNRGGLLVAGEKVQGFVPISHIIGAPEALSEEDRKTFLCSYLGKILDLKIIEFVPAEDRLVLSERAAQAGEGKRKLLFANIKPGIHVPGVVTNVTDFGVFVDLGGLEGLIHVSELSWGRVDHPRDVLCVGQRIETLVLSVSEENSRIALSYKRLSNNPWDAIHEIYAPGDVVSAKISGVTKYGAFARLKEGVEGLIHISTLNFPDDAEDIHAILERDQCVQVKILHIDAEKKRIGLCLESD